MESVEIGKQHLWTFSSEMELHEAYILAGFAFQRERIEGLAVFSKSLLSALHYLLNIEK